MARPVKMRSNYRADGAYLLRLEDALLKDRRRSEKWRQDSARMARRLALRLLDADVRVRWSGLSRPPRKTAGHREVR